MLAGIGVLAYTQTKISAKPTLNTEDIMDTNIDWKHIKKSEWKDRLDDAEFYVLRKEGTERSFSSALNAEKRAGTFVCAGCALPLFTSETKFESGTGWPSFHTPITNNVETKRDFKLVLPRTEYHCARCGGHQGHVFKDGPKPSGLRYCNNGVALDFVPT
ncbi:MAG: peptide-methionine (R)-S-oxide reductase [Robiginitomaculum sp.]|nr:MAG: peptide-methionine (R)-S-oxide reductase [Robiginitomaculum sp.]